MPSEPASVPPSHALTAEEPTGFPDDVTHDELVADWYLYQRKGGHRTSTDDVLAAWYAARHASRHPVARYLDLGCGVGSVLLLTAHAIRPALAHGVEAQPQSVAMARRSIAELPDAAADRMSMCVHHSDFRSFLAAPPRALAEKASEAPLAESERFDLITGSPPYFPVGTGVLPSDPQRRACRFELRGGVEAYCETGARLLAMGGSLVLVFQTTWDERVLAAASSAGLRLRGRCDVLMRSDRLAPFLSVYRFTAHAGRDAETGAIGTDADAVTNMSIDIDIDIDIDRGFAIRDADGELTPQYAEARALLGLRTTR